MKNVQIPPSGGVISNPGVKIRVTADIVLGEVKATLRAFFRGDPRECVRRQSCEAANLNATNTHYVLCQQAGLSIRPHIRAVTNGPDAFGRTASSQARAHEQRLLTRDERGEASPPPKFD